MKNIKVFADSDTIISSLISSTGAAHFLIHNANLDLYISDKSIAELQIVANRLKLNQNQLKTLIKNKFKVKKLNSSSEVKKKFSKYTFDENDCHIIAGAVEAKTAFLITYNLKHFNLDKIKQDFKIITLTPAKLLQYLRSRNA